MINNRENKMTQQGLYISVPFLPANKAQVNATDTLDILRKLESAMKNVAENSTWLSRKYPGEFRRILSAVHSISGYELQDFELKGENE